MAVLVFGLFQPYWQKLRANTASVAAMSTSHQLAVYWMSTETWPSGWDDLEGVLGDRTLAPGHRKWVEVRWDIETDDVRAMLDSARLSSRVLIGDGPLSPEHWLIRASDRTPLLRSEPERSTMWTESVIREILRWQMEIEAAEAADAASGAAVD